jgi:hypothetical protein
MYVFELIYIYMEEMFQCLACSRGYSKTPGCFIECIPRTWSNLLQHVNSLFPKSISIIVIQYVSNTSKTPLNY